MSVKVKLQMKSPDNDVPQWATVSASTKPGMLASHCSVKMGIWVLSRLPGFVPLNPLLKSHRKPDKMRSMVAELIDKGLSDVSSDMAE